MYIKFWEKSWYLYDKKQYCIILFLIYIEIHKKNGFEAFLKYYIKENHGSKKSSLMSMCVFLLFKLDFLSKSVAVFSYPFNYVWIDIFFRLLNDMNSVYILIFTLIYIYIYISYFWLILGIITAKDVIVSNWKSRLSRDIQFNYTNNFRIFIWIDHWWERKSFDLFVWILNRSLIPVLFRWKSSDWKNWNNA